MSPTATLGIPQLAKDLRVSTKTVRRMIRTEALPKPSQMNQRAYRWLQSEILLWQQLGMPNRQEFERLAAKQRRADA